MLGNDASISADLCYFGNRAQPRHLGKSRTYHRTLNLFCPGGSILFMPDEKQSKTHKMKFTQRRTAMSSTGLKGPSLLTAERIRVTVAATSPGVYALGHTNDEGTFVVERLGRSDENVKKNTPGSG